MSLKIDISRVYRDLFNKLKEGEDLSAHEHAGQKQIYHVEFLSQLPLQRGSSILRS